MGDAEGAAGQAPEAGDAVDGVAVGGGEIGAAAQEFELGDGHANEAKRGQAGVFDADVGADFEGVAVGAQLVVGRVHAVGSVQGMAIAGDEAGERAVQARTVGRLHVYSLGHETIVGGL